MVKKIYTSYYAKYKSRENGTSISASAPSYFTGPHLKVLAPSWEILNDFKEGKISEEEYSKKYIALLKSRNLTPLSIYNSIPDGTVMLCYEKTGDFCHRRVLAKWLEDELDITIPEWVPEDEARRQELVDSLFEF